MRDITIPVAGYIPLSSVDWPEKLVSTVFLQGCTWKCGYCHNPDLIPVKQKTNYTWNEYLLFLSRRVGLLDGAVFSGGEPTIHRELPEAMENVKTFGFGVGLHTSGVSPMFLSRCIDLVDWIGLDIKSSPDNYETVTQGKNSGKNAYRSLELVLDTDIPYEVRTTISKEYFSVPDIISLAIDLEERGVTNYCLQNARLPDGYGIFTSDELNYLEKEIKSLGFEKFTLRR